MRTQTKAAVAVAAAIAIALAVLFTWTQVRAGETDPVAVTGVGQRPAVVQDDSHVLGKPGDSDVTFVEFLDFECEACRAAYPLVERLREQYAGEVTFVARYFPLPGHFNAERAARAVEAAARQGKFEEMYHKMYETQTEWGEAQTSHDDLFRDFAEDLGLDMDQYDADYASEDVRARVQRDVEDGVALGVQGTPTFFINGELFQPQTVEDFASALDDALEDANSE